MAIAAEAPALPLADPASLGLDPERIERLCAFIEGQIAEGHYPGAQIAFARHGKLAAFRSFTDLRSGSCRELRQLRGATDFSVTLPAGWQDAAGGQ